MQEDHIHCRRLCCLAGRLCPRCSEAPSGTNQQDIAERRTIREGVEATIWALQAIVASRCQVQFTSGWECSGRAAHLNDGQLSDWLQECFLLLCALCAKIHDLQTTTGSHQDDHKVCHAFSTISLCQFCYASHGDAGRLWLVSP